MIAAARTPCVADLASEECRALLARNHIGRIAYAADERVDIRTLHYAYEDGWVFGRTNFGSKLHTLARHPRCAFQVEEIRGAFDWDSVVGHGRFELLDPQTGSVDRYDRAVSLLELLIPGALGVNDPAPSRTMLFGIHLSKLTGRSAASH